MQLYIYCNEIQTAFKNSNYFKPDEGIDNPGKKRQIDNV